MDKSPLFTTDCPNCGALVESYSATAVTLVCAHCSRMLVFKGKGLGRHIVDSGRDSVLSEDFSPLKIGTEGVFAERKFTLVGRLQVHTDADVWNRWYALFDDGLTGWLSEAGNWYAMTCEASGRVKGLPKTFESVRAGFSSLELEGKIFTVSDIRTIRYNSSGALGELPFNMTAKKAVGKVCNFRSGNLFLTLDYTASPITAYLGQVLSLNSLKPENLRSDDEIRKSTGRLKNEIRSESCPACGTPVQWPNGATAFLFCPSCGSSLNTSKDTVKLMSANTRKQQQERSFTLPIGATGRLNDTEYQIIGAVKYTEIPFGSISRHFGRSAADRQYGSWNEYLLYNTQQGFAWLVESEYTWRLSHTMRTWPNLADGGTARNAKVLDRYGGRVEAVAGAFYWHIKRGDVTDYTEYRADKSYPANTLLCCEQTRNETVWSSSVPVLPREMMANFGLSQSKAGLFVNFMNNKNRLPTDRDEGIRIVATLVYLIINIPAWTMPNPDVEKGFFFSMFVLGWIWFSGRFKDDDDYEEERSMMLFGFVFVILITTVGNYYVEEDDGYYSGSGGYYGGFSGGHK